MLVDPGAAYPQSQARNNRSTLGQWDWFSQHRANVERLIVPAAPGGRICILGAGNCNDLDLVWLAQVYQDIQLVDLDRDAVERGIARQGGDAGGRIRMVAPHDLTAIAPTISAWNGRSVSPSETQKAADQVLSGWAAAELGGGFDTVLSPCVLSQLLVCIRDVLGIQHEGWPALRAAIILRHLRTVVGLLKPGGRGVLAVDLTSSKTINGLDRAKPGDLPALMQLAIRDGKCFRGLEPANLRATIAGDAELRGAVADIQISPPWLWHLSLAKTFLTYGMTIRRR